MQGGGLTKAGNLKLTFSEGGKESNKIFQNIHSYITHLVSGAIEFTTILRNLLERIGGKLKRDISVISVINTRTHELYS